ncbi:MULTISPECIES: efflux RND transporter permease subunit [unclassified Microbacterium]|uniref:efflux RND transporter permease subunit n=1 Tax=unclassified Microbacterium TaxID=2609290 RepID=UPI00214C47F8|nr:MULTISPECIES: efflux RND transporter permease subunit [unclassified Microbacterium]MCR2784651.1 efflux RND transporter permease subunit [Microbacterium sp. zg.B96]WIM16193.1 efflux RND transporter permease subunit [Microbacterium sp. zg-B96]
MSNLAVLSLKNRALIALVTIVAAVFGGLALTNLKQELIPSIEFPALSVVATYPGASPDVVANDVSTPIETAIQGVPGLESTSATSTTNASIIQASFAYGTDLATAEQKISQAINRIKGQLPESVDPQVFSLSIDDLPVIQLAVTGYDDEAAVQDLLESTVIPDLEDVEGVNAAEVIGGAGQRITITPDQAALAAAGFSQQAISDALEQNGVLFPGGGITEDGQTLTVQTGAKIASIEEIGQLPLVPTEAAQFAAEPVTIADVATVAEEKDPQTSISRVDGEPALTIAVTKLPAANTVDVSTGVLAALPDLEKALEGEAEFTVVFDQAPYIQQSIEALAQEGLLGLVFAVLVILVFLLSVRSTLVTAISIPTSVLITFVGIQAFGYSLNILTLGALTIAIGRVVDDSIVVIENIKRHYVGTADKTRSILLAVREVAAAITASTITTVAVFLPIAFVGDMTGELFRPFALTVTIAMTASLFVSLTIVPVLAYWFLRPGKPLLDADGNQIDPEHPDAPPSRLQKMYLPILRWTLKHSWVTLLLAVLVLAGTAAAAPFMKTNFLGDTGQNTFTMTQDLGPAASLEAKDAAAQTVEDELLEVPGVETVQVSIGSSGSALADAFSGGSSGATFSVTTDPDADQLVVREEVLDVVAGLEDVGTVAVSATGGFGSSDIEIDVTAPDQQTLQEATDAVVTAIDGKDGVEQVTTNLSDSLPYIAVVVDRAAAAALGLSEVAVGALVSGTMQPQQLGTVEIDGTALTVYLAASQTPATLEELRDLQVPSATGPIPLSQIATVEQSQGPTSITTEGGQRTATVSVTPSGDDLTTASTVVNEALADADLPASADATLGGVVSQQQDAFTQLGLAMLAAILIVYIVMVATFKSLRQPLLLLVSVPFAATGAILLQIATGVPLGVASLIGVLMLIGIVVTNAIVLVDLVNQYRVKGLSARDATIAGGARRLRPILMTALATIFALTPMALGITGHGGFISQPLAIVVIGGLISSTFLTLLVLPTLYNLVEGARERRAARRGEPALAGAVADGATDGGGATAPLTRRDRRVQSATITLPVVIPDAPRPTPAAAGGGQDAGDAPATVTEVAAVAPGADVEVADAQVADATTADAPTADAAVDATTADAAVEPGGNRLSALSQAVQPARVGEDVPWSQPQSAEPEAEPADDEASATVVDTAPDPEPAAEDVPDVDAGDEPVVGSADHAEPDADQELDAEPARDEDDRS